jgi:molybdopterin synthase catalytic subunit
MIPPREPAPQASGAPRAAIVRAAIDPAAVLAELGAPSDGAVLLFLGTVRDHAEGRAVGGMGYEAYEEMAADVLRAIAQEAAERLGTPRVVVVHRIGELEIGEVSVAIGVSSPHRESAYDASRYVIEEIKRRLPVWKHERFVTGEPRWVEGHPLAPPSSAPARMGFR